MSILPICFQITELNISSRLVLQFFEGLFHLSIFDIVVKPIFLTFAFSNVPKNDDELLSRDVILSLTKLILKKRSLWQSDFMPFNFDEVLTTFQPYNIKVHDGANSGNKSSLASFIEVFYYLPVF